MSSYFGLPADKADAKDRTDLQDAVDSALRRTGIACD
jgi:hypothetical protein